MNRKNEPAALFAASVRPVRRRSHAVRPELVKLVSRTLHAGRG